MDIWSLAGMRDSSGISIFWIFATFLLASTSFGKSFASYAIRHVYRRDQHASDSVIRQHSRKSAIFCCVWNICPFAISHDTILFMGHSYRWAINYFLQFIVLLVPFVPFYHFIGNVRLVQKKSHSARWIAHSTLVCFRNRTRWWLAAYGFDQMSPRMSKSSTRKSHSRECIFACRFVFHSPPFIVWCFHFVKWSLCGALVINLTRCGTFLCVCVFFEQISNAQIYGFQNVPSPALMAPSRTEHLIWSDFERSSNFCFHARNRTKSPCERQENDKQITKRDEEMAPQWIRSGRHAIPWMRQKSSSVQEIVPSWFQTSFPHFGNFSFRKRFLIQRVHCWCSNGLYFKKE